jgi:hypothetical protein
MAWRPTGFVVDGELDNTTPGWTVGWIQLKGRDELLRLKLAGNCHPDLAGWKFRIVRTETCPDRDATVDVTNMATDQSGLIGDVTADQMLRHYDCSDEEFLRRTEEGCQPPTTWRKALYLEWFSNRNGRVVIQSTRLVVKRLGARAFELTQDQFLEQARQNQEEIAFFMERLADALSHHSGDDGVTVADNE